MRTIVILSNHHLYTYNLRKDIIQALIDTGNRVVLVLPYGDRVQLLRKMGCEFIDVQLDRRGTNPFVDLKLIIRYFKILRSVNPNVVLSYTVKPNIYGGLACRILNLPFIPNVTGLGTAVENRSIVQRLLTVMYRVSFKGANCVFFQNEKNKEFFDRESIKVKKHRLIPGSGVNLTQHCFEEYPMDDRTTRFLFIGRIMKDKGIEELIDAAITVKKQHKNVQFDAVGFYEEDYKNKAEELERLGVIRFHGVQDDVHEFIKNCSAVVLPSYHEGMANVLLEAASTGRPVLASNIPGCAETFDEGISGFGFEPKDSEDLANVLMKFIDLPYERKKAMGIAGRQKMEREFDRNIVVNAYLEEIDRIINT